MSYMSCLLQEGLYVFQSQFVEVLFPLQIVPVEICDILL